MAQDYKTLKENFVSNLSGGSVLEINYVTAVAPVSIPKPHFVCKADAVSVGCILVVVCPSGPSRLFQ